MKTVCGILCVPVWTILNLISKYDLDISVNKKIIHNKECAFILYLILFNR